MLSADVANNDGASETLTSQEVFDNCKTLFYAGHDTSATALTWWLALVAHQDYASRLYVEVSRRFETENPTFDKLAELQLLNASIKETMRLYPPASALFQRRLIRDVRVGEYLFPKGAIVNVPIGHIQHDPEFFVDPETFRPERFLPGASAIARNAYMPFGLGPRFCLGQYFATQELTLIAARLIKEFKVKFRDGGVLPAARVDVVLRPIPSIMLQLERH
jgi:cytochrome P450